MCANAMWIKNFVLVVIITRIICQKTQIKFNSMEPSKNNVETTILIDKSSRKLIQNLTTDHQLKVIQKMTEYRLQRIMHHERSFGNNDNVHWNKCLDQRNSTIEGLSQNYTDAEGICSKLALADVRDKNRSVKQILKQITEWRRGFKYLLRQCKEKHPKNKQGAEACLDEYIQKDHYDITLSKLQNLLNDSETILKNSTEESINTLDTCLEVALSEYLEKVRVLKNTLNECYEKKLRKRPVIEELKKHKCVSMEIVRLKSNNY